MSSSYTRDHHAAVQLLMYGHMHVPDHTDFTFAWKAVKAIAAGDGVLSEPERLCLVGRMAALLTPVEVMEEVEAWDATSEAPAELLKGVQVPKSVRRGTGAWIVYNGLAVAAADDELADGELEAIFAVARTMDLDRATVDALRRLVEDEADARMRRIEILHGTVDEEWRFTHSETAGATTTILITGATGTVGSRTVEALSGLEGVAVRAAVRSPEQGGKFADLIPPVATVELDFAREETIDRALEGVDKAFLITPFDEEQVASSKRFIDAAKRAGVKHLVRLSALGADLEPGTTIGRWHGEIERYALDSGLQTTILRPGIFMTNFTTTFGPDEQGKIRLPLGDGATPYVDPRDIADVAATVLTSDGHEGKTYTLTGPEPVTVPRVAALLSEATGRKIEYVDVPEEASRGAMQELGAPGWMIDGLLELYSSIKAGQTTAVSDDVRAVGGCEPRTFAEFVRDHADAWR